MFMWSASASESSGVIGPTSRRTRPRLSRSRVRASGSSGRRLARRTASIASQSTTGTVTLAFRELLYLVVVLDWTPQLLRPRAASLLGETALPSGPGGCRRDTPSRDRERRAE